ncbi:MAG: SUMF1/EgtB/PvdO family nonheme iron enzyme [Lentisphaerota bacterium]
MKGKGWVTGWRGRWAVIFLLAMAVVCRLWKPDDPSARCAHELNLVFVKGGLFRMGSREELGSRPPVDVPVGSYWMGRYEVSVREFAIFLNETPAFAFLPGGSIKKRGDGSWAPKWFSAHKPMTHVSHEEAAAYCRWASEKYGVKARLPSEAEWEYAARGGIPDARYPWGWGTPANRACFKAAKPRKTGCYPPNAFGLFDLAGNVFEWCRADGSPDAFPARGGSWAESDERMLRVHHVVLFSSSYRNADVGFRILVEQ